MPLPYWITGCWRVGIEHSVTTFKVTHGGSFGPGDRGVSDLSAIDSAAPHVALGYGRTHDWLRWEATLEYTDNSGSAHKHFDIMTADDSVPGVASFFQDGQNSISARAGWQLNGAWLYLGLAYQSQDLRYRVEREFYDPETQGMARETLDRGDWTSRNIHGLVGGIFEVNDHLRVRLEHNRGNADSSTASFGGEQIGAQRIDFLNGEAHATRLSLGWQF